ncbi:hypothetical protein K443DRAFT_329155 [Laccaria amethystina LaAM-08-1]|uniref:Uncharacterized protein n=1 Tax=Laccaria amethystina LaAM-08-1 TaxID=1095629 RepID=A0A0C9XCK4_9AGAR|nr:hypothetical protein K443DRAFT_329155 [Laccaria amethystina LaAM-08-1]
MGRIAIAIAEFTLELHDQEGQAYSVHHKYVDAIGSEIIARFFVDIESQDFRQCLMYLGIALWFQHGDDGEGMHKFLSVLEVSVALLDRRVINKSGGSCLTSSPTMPLPAFGPLEAPSGPLGTSSTASLIYSSVSPA